MEMRVINVFLLECELELEETSCAERNEWRRCRRQRYVQKNKTETEHTHTRNNIEKK